MAGDTRAPVRPPAAVWIRSKGFWPLLSGCALLSSCALLLLFALARSGDGQREQSAAVPFDGLPRQDLTGGYVTSEACRPCHAAQHQSWYASYHRSMTARATPEHVQAPWSDVRLSHRGRSYLLFRRAGEYWARLPDPDHAGRQRRAAIDSASAPEVERQVVMTTGSHHYQAFWTRGARGNELWQLPFIYHFESRRFIPRHDAFLQPEEDPEHQARWNSNCIQCHAVGGKPAHDPASDRFDSRVVELGIACEACHGPGAAHVARHEANALPERWRRGAAADPTIVNPARLSAERASEICAQCHAYFVPRDEEAWWRAGFSESYRPGAPLDPSRHVFDYERDLPHASALVSSSLESLFYADGTIRVGGREWNGLRRSACFERGHGERRASCLSCHQMHGGSRADQLRSRSDPDASCRNCHDGVAAEVEAHSHHAAASSGSRCMNCHMPLTTYALFKGIRSHRITRPTRAFDVAGAAPNACNLCHQDRSVAWTLDWLSRWYGRTPLTDRRRREPSSALPAAAVGLLSADAATRVVYAYAMGWEPAREVAGAAFQAQLLAEALDDPYAAVRFVAQRSLASLPGFGGLSHDFIAERSQRLLARDRARQLAADLHPSPGESIDPKLMAELIGARDERPIRIAE